jgi:hypothetical protein
MVAVRRAMMTLGWDKTLRTGWEASLLFISGN